MLIFTIKLCERIFFILVYLSHLYSDMCFLAIAVALFYLKWLIMLNLLMVTNATMMPHMFKTSTLHFKKKNNAMNNV